jgi:hypothetical protein
MSDYPRSSARIRRTLGFSAAAELFAKDAEYGTTEGEDAPLVQG